VVGDALKVCTWAAEGTGQVVSTPISCQRVHWLVDFFRAVFVDRKAVCKTFSSSSTVSGLVSFETDSRWSFTWFPFQSFCHCASFACSRLPRAEFHYYQLVRAAVWHLSSFAALICELFHQERWSPNLWLSPHSISKCKTVSVLRSWISFAANLVSLPWLAFGIRASEFD
jgi:hypothetical protein